MHRTCGALAEVLFINDRPSVMFSIIEKIERGGNTFVKITILLKYLTYFYIFPPVSFVLLLFLFLFSREICSFYLRLKNAVKEYFLTTRKYSFTVNEYIPTVFLFTAFFYSTIRRTLLVEICRHTF